jgi:hypothetical protein
MSFVPNGRKAGAWTSTRPLPNMATEFAAADELNPDPD